MALTDFWSSGPKWLAADLNVNLHWVSECEQPDEEERLKLSLKKNIKSWNHGSDGCVSDCCFWLGFFTLLENSMLCSKC